MITVILFSCRIKPESDVNSSEKYYECIRTIETVQKTDFEELFEETENGFFLRYEQKFREIIAGNTKQFVFEGGNLATEYHKFIDKEYSFSEFENDLANSCAITAYAEFISKKYEYFFENNTKYKGDAYRFRKQANELWKMLITAKTHTDIKNVLSYGENIGIVIKRDDYYYSYDLSVSTSTTLSELNLD